MKHIPLQLALALLTFSIGILLTSSGAFAHYSQSSMTSQISVVSNNTIEYSENNQLTIPEINENGIDIEYAWSLIGVESLDGYFYVKNNTGETVTYLANNFGQSNPFLVKQSGKTKKVNLPFLVGIDAAKEQELKPNESTVLSIPVPQNDKPFEAGFNFLVGIERKEKVIWVKVEKQLKSSGLPCNEEIMKAGCALSKTCITKVPNPN